MGLFKTQAEREMDVIIARIDMNMSNNYKDAAQLNLQEFESALEAYKDSAKYKENVYLKYESILGSYKERLKGYTHKDQKPYWT